MYKIFVSLVILVMLSLGAVNSFAADSLLLDSFEGEIIPAGITSGSMSGNVDYGSGGGSSVEVYADDADKVDGKQSLKVVFFAMPGGWIWIARGYNIDVKGAGAWNVRPQDIKWDKYNAISFWMKGTKSGKQLAFDIIDAKKEYFRYLVQDDSDIWKQVIIPFKSFEARTDWQPNNATKNKTIDFPIMTYQFEPRPKNEGEWSFDKVELINVKTENK
ncbi:MAG: carbohydrate binding domain-containing protein [bacterium]|nr:carbohydrate binding domain-containing protein [bacterium]